MPPAAAHSFRRHRFLVAFSILAVVLLGFFALGRLPIDLLSPREAPRLRVSVSVPGVPAPVIVEKVTQPLEAALTGVAGVSAVESVTTSGGAFVDLYLNHRRDAEAAQRGVTARLAPAGLSLPASVARPTVSLLDDSSIVAEFAITSPRHDLLALRDWAEGEFAKRLQELSGVSAVDVTGGAVREVLVMPDQRRLAGLGIGFDDVLQALGKTPEADAGTRKPPVKFRGRRVTLPSGNAAAVAALPVALPSGESIPLSEIARITLSEEVLPEQFRFDGTDAIKVTVQKQSRAAASEVIERIQAHIDWMRANRLVPDGVEIHFISHRMDQARQALRQATQGLLAGFALVLFSAYLVLGSGRRTLILAVVIAASMQAVFVAMALSGRALDAMSLFGLAFGTGLFGVTAVLLFERAAPAMPAQGPTVNPAIVVSVILVMALVPVLFAGDGIAAMFGEFAWVLGAASLTSALLAPVLVAAFDTRRRARARWNSIVHSALDRLRRSYVGLLRRSMRRPAPILVVSLALAGVVAATAVLNREEPPPPQGGHDEELVLRVQGPSDEQLAVIGDELVRRLRALPDWREVQHSGRSSRKELVLQMDEDRARELGVDVIAAGKALAVALSGIPAGSFSDAEHHYDIRLRLPPEESASAAALGRILLLGELDNRPAVHLHDVATVERAIEPVQIRRYNGMPMIEVTLSRAGSAPAQALARVQETLERYTLPAGYRIFYGSPGPAPEESHHQGLRTLGSALLFVFAALVLLLRSPRMALVATYAAFVSLAGIVAAMWLFDVPLSSPVWLGALVLIGVTAGDAAVAVSYLTAKSVQGLPLPELIARTGKHLFRRFLLMTLMTMLGMTPLLVAGDNAVMLRPLIMTVTTGLVFSFFASLLLAPLLYLFVVRREEQSSTPPRL